MLYLCKWKFEGRKTLPKTSALHVEDRKQKKNFTEEELSITSTSALSFLPLPLSFPWQTGGLHQSLPNPVP